MKRVLVSILLVLLVIFIVPVVVYGSLASMWGLQTPEGASPFIFLLGTLVTKMGTAIAFVLIYYFAKKSLDKYFLLYAFIWWLMFAFGEVGQVISNYYSWKEAITGILSETIYLPISAMITRSLLRNS